MQRLYSPRHGLDLTETVRDGDVLLVPYGYHTTAAAHGYDLYYLNALAGDRRSMQAADDPELAWVRRAWSRSSPTRACRWSSQREPCSGWHWWARGGWGGRTPARSPSSSEVEIVCVVEPSDEAAALVDAPRATLDDLPEVDGALVCVPTRFHVEVVTRSPSSACRCSARSRAG